MPRKIYNDEELREKALKLRAQGLTYREIAEELGCSTWKVHEVLTTDGKSEIMANLSLLKEEIRKLRDEVENSMLLLETNALKWFETCRFPDEEGYCTRRLWSYPHEGLNMKSEVTNGQTLYWLNVREHVLFCLGCVFHEQKTE